MNKILRLSMVMVFGFVFASMMASAIVYNATDLEVEASARGTLSSTAKTNSIVAGNVTELELNVSIITEGWAGYYGNVKGTIFLDDASAKSMYTWTLAPAGEVYATKNSSLDWTAGNIVCAKVNNATIVNNDTFPGSYRSFADNVTKTFNLSTHPAITTNGNTLAADSCSYSLSTYVSDDSDGARAYNETMLWSISDEGVVFAAIINADKTGFDDGTYDFQMLVPENGHGNSALTAYYFFLEL